MNSNHEGAFLSTRAAPHWKRIGIRPHHGFAIPLFSLKTEKSAGIGEYLDLLPLIEFAKMVGFDVIQLLPLNDTGRETSPYSALSSLALNPIYLSLHALPNIEKINGFKEKISYLYSLNEEDRVNIPKLFDFKMAFLRDYFQLVFPEIEKTNEYRNFIEENSWLENYALFKAIKEAQGWSSWERWPLAIRSPSSSNKLHLLEIYKTEIDFHKFLQFYSFQQLERAHEAARSAGILLKGDIPILISRDSADVWGSRYRFLLELAAGAPPDPFSKEYQAWGIPVYDWEEMEKEGYIFWKERLQVAERFYDLYRLDHVVGFFRIWTIPSGRRPHEGHFFPENEAEWIPQGEKMMENLLDFTLMLPIAEDLGTVPPSVKKCLRSLGIPGTKVIRWERYWEHPEQKYIPLSEYDPISMTTVSTHDSDTLNLWWRHSPREAKLFAELQGWEYRPFLDLDKAFQILHQSHHTPSLFHINLLNEYLALYPDYVSHNPLDERINIPGKILPSNWSYRLIPKIEELKSNNKLISLLQNLSK